MQRIKREVKTGEIEIFEKQAKSESTKKVLFAEKNMVMELGKISFMLLEGKC